MINDPVYKHFLELSWRRKLNAVEEEELRAWLIAHPEAQAAWEMETGLNEVLGMMPDAAVLSNFNARVMQGIEQEEASEKRRAARRRIAWWRKIIPRVALAVAVVGVGIFSYQQYRLAERREQARQAEVVQSFIAISKVPFLSDPETLEDFDTIRLGPGLVADERLLTLLQ
jgi:hypothetical protein